MFDPVSPADALRVAAARFREYEAHHAAKPDEEKAARNRDMAEVCEEALKGMEQGHPLLEIKRWPFEESPGDFSQRLGRSVGYITPPEGLLASVRQVLIEQPPKFARWVYDLGSAFQQRVAPWMMACFGEAISNDRQERSDRFLEEALELCQASGYDEERAHTLVRYVFGRPKGELGQETGGVMVTLAAFCLAHGIDMHAAGEEELARIWNPATLEKIREKQKAKRNIHSPLPIDTATALGNGDSR